MNNSICTLFDNILIDIHKFKSLHYENSMPIKYKDTIKKENYLIFPMQNMVMLCKVDSLVVNVIFHTSSKLYANVTSSKKCQVIKN